MFSGSGRSDAQFGRYPNDDVRCLSRARSVAAQAVLILIHRRRDHALAIGRADAIYAILRRTNHRRRGEGQPDLFRAVRIVAIHAVGVPIVIQQFALVRGMRVIHSHRRDRVADLRRRHLGIDIRRLRSHVRAAAVASEARLIVGGSQQHFRASCAKCGTTSIHFSSATCRARAMPPASLRLTPLPGAN